MALNQNPEAGNNETPKLTLRASDGEDFFVSEQAARLSVTIKHMLEDDDCEKHVIPLLNVNSKTLAKVIEYLNRHAKESSLPDEEKKDESSLPNEEKKKMFTERMEKFDEFLSVPMEVLFDLVLAANYLNIKGLMDIACKKIADTIKDRGPNYVRKQFSITNDFTPEEEDEVKKENAWAFEGIPDDD